MATLTSLPNKPIELIFTQAPDLQSTASLSATNRSLHQIWLQGTERIAGEIINSKILAYEQAVDLAIAEQRLDSNSVATTLPNGRLPFHRYAERLLSNDKLAKSAATAWAAWLAVLGTKDTGNYRLKLTFNCPHAAYYILRKLVLSYHHS
jgi:hypothetical protein